jgi:error-prone DNA polymerase
MTERYVELRCQSAFSFLRGASLPEDLVEEAARLGYSALGLGDRDGVYGAPRFFRAAKDAGIRPLVGAEVVLESGEGLYLLVENRTGYKNLCRLLTRAKLGQDTAGARQDAGPWVGKRAAGVSLADLVPHVEGLFCLAGGTSGPFSISRW